MTIDTQKLREVATNAKNLTAEDLSGFRLTVIAHITGLARAIESCCDHIEAQQVQINRHRRASERWKKIAEFAEERVRNCAAEIARLRDALLRLEKGFQAGRDNANAMFCESGNMYHEGRKIAYDQAAADVRAALAQGEV